MLLGVDWATRAEVQNRKVAKAALLANQVVFFMEQLPALKWNQMTKNLSYKFFCQDANNLITIGKVMASDITLNFSKRFPCNQIWPESKGAVSNFLFVTEPLESNTSVEWDVEENTQFESLAAIDNELFPYLENSKELKVYLKRIDSFIATVLAESSKVANGANARSISHLVSFVQQTCNYTLRPQDQFRILQGILIGVLNIATEGPFCVSSALQETAEAQ